MKHTIDLQDRVEQLNNEIQEYAQDIEELEQRASEVKQEEGADSEEFEDLEDDFEETITEKKLAERELNVFEDTINEWGGSEVIIEELTFGEVQEVKDLTIDESFDVDVQRESVEGSPKEGFYQIIFIKKSIVKGPGGMPTQRESVHGRSEEVADPSAFQDSVGEWLFEVIDNINTFGDSELGNTSLEERIS